MKRNGANLTEGKPVKLILQFAIPVFLGNLFQLFYGLIDTKIVGSTLGEGALAAVGSVSILYNLLTGFFNCLTLGFSVVTARYFGAGDTEKLKKSVAGTILLGFVTAALMLGCGWAVMVMIMAYTISTCLVGFIASTQNAEILYWGTTYLRVDMLFEMVCVWIVILRNTMQGVGDYKTPIFSSFLELACKIVFTAVFVRYFGYWGVIWTEPVTWIIMVIPLIVMLKKNPVFHQKKTA